MKNAGNKPLLAEFKAASYDEWKDAAVSLLKGAPFEKKLYTLTPEGITLQPIYRREDLATASAAATMPGFDGYTRGARADGYRSIPWEIAQELPYGDPAEFNRIALGDLHRGQDALNITLDIATLKGLDPDAARDGEVAACGLSLATLWDFNTAFANIYPNAISIYFQSGCAGAPIYALFRAWLASQDEANLAEIKGGLGVDPMSVLASAGALPTSPDQLYDEMFCIAELNAVEMPKFTSMGVSGLPYHCAGASATQELAAMLATGLEYLRALTSRGLDINAAASQIRFSAAIGGSFFMELAKLRAARQLWARIVKELGGDSQAQLMRLHARTGFNNKTRHDPYANMLRSATEALCGVTAGVDSLCVGSFDEIIREPDEFSRRVARNTQVILQEECELTAVVDPAGGSWYIESLTEEVARKAWGLFQEIESAGGMLEALHRKVIQDMVADTARKKSKLVGQRRLSLVGANQYPNLGEKPLESRIPDYAAIRQKRASQVERRRMQNDEKTDELIMALLVEIQESPKQEKITKMIEAVTTGATLGEISRALRANAGPAICIEALPNHRLAEDYEELRSASAAYAATNGHGPKIFLTNLGALRRHKIRADFTRNFFETGGFEMVSSAGFSAPDVAVGALKESGAKITVICGIDDDYVEQAPALIRAIKTELPDTIVILAGDPCAHEATYREAGLDDFIFIKTDNYAANRKYLELLEVL
ncbi:methylmalonyl-CoA mutase family protein [Cerasicoccus arenae]|uniref:Methylmalonyl-CoA mutase n=1 Tax=Cerasicoccus arenae TaxID=424488 RepID=A0A8J3DD69_9BACT|nr:methylmalonyl-CoA mutase family protein [Cerasicoccus arenae]MBK1857615.1 acyl-CoA mutase large subunit family protein [Cerasicoccus arenae]GHC05557.1 methylmalonyl-CoA mutase [Cerasicoccus arenae]